MGSIVENLEDLRTRVREADAPVLVYCHHGVRSMHAAAWLAAQGLPGVANLSGGIDAYSREADPTVPRYGP
jgi:rhodanese-related sulfurtransferase